LEGCFVLVGGRPDFFYLAYFTSQLYLLVVTCKRGMPNPYLLKYYQIILSLSRIICFLDITLLLLYSFFSTQIIRNLKKKEKKMESDEQKVIFLKGKKTILRPLNKKTDLESCVRWINDPEVIQYVSMYLPSSEQDEEKWFDDLQKRKEDVILAIETLEGKFIGITGLHRINWKDRTAGHGVIIGERDCWGYGYGIDSHLVLLEYAFNTLNLYKIYSSVIAFNERSKNYHLACGYHIEGTQRNQIFKKGKYWDLFLFGVFEEEWLAVWEKYQVR